MIRSLDDKDPDSTEWVTWDFSGMLAPGDALASVVGTAVDVTDDAGTALVLLGAPSILDTSSVSQQMSTGTPGYRYVVRCRILTVNAEELDLSFYVYIAPQ